ncbi:MAG TPA: NAD(P)/FAD-dependent oxidoreductase [Micropepsaceae bacterium]|nr:NAD(P)/FAD-dependent oxidoreductase [Micropepsaceae bacterium]
MNPSAFDVLVIGGGLNGLVAAITLARAKRRVALIEAEARLGGRIVTEEVNDGFKSALCVHELGMLAPKVVQSCRLKKHGLTFTDTRLPAIAMSAAGRPLAISPLPKRAIASIAALSQRDAAAYAQFLSDAARLARLILGARKKGVSLEGAVARASQADKALFDLWSRAGIADLAEHLFEMPLLRGYLCFEAVRGNNLHPRTPGTLLALALALAARQRNAEHRLGEPKGGPGGLIAALETSARAQGVVVMTGAPIERLLAEDGRIMGAELADGRSLSAPHVIAAMGADGALGQLLGHRHLEVETSRDLRATHPPSGAGKVVLALDAAPNFRGLEPEQYRARLIFAPDISAVEAASEACASGALAAEPVFEAVMPSVRDPMLTDVGQHTLSVMVPFVPHRADEDAHTARDALARAVMARLSPIAPDVTDHSVGGQVLTPADLAARFGAAGYHWQNAALDLSACLSGARAFGVTHNETGIAGLVLAGTDMSALAGATGLSGRHAAKSVLKSSQPEKTTRHG